MVAADHDGRFQFTRRDHLVEGEAEPVAVAEPDPADARGQTLKLDFLARHVEPVVEVRVVGEQLLHLGVDLVDILGIARQRHPAERSEEHTSELQSLMRISYAVFCLKKKKKDSPTYNSHTT